VTVTLCGALFAQGQWALVGNVLFNITLLYQFVGVLPGARKKPKLAEE
jgi:hypothetical protein